MNLMNLSKIYKKNSMIHDIDGWDVDYINKINKYLRYIETRELYKSNPVINSIINQLLNGRPITKLTDKQLDLLENVVLKHQLIEEWFCEDRNSNLIDNNKFLTSLKTFFLDNNFLTQKQIIHLKKYGFPYETFLSL